MSDGWRAETPDYGVPTGVVPRRSFNGSYTETAPDTPLADLTGLTPGSVMYRMTNGELEIAPASRAQVGGTHYSKLPIQPWDYVAANGLGYFEGSIVKYVSRWKDKGGVEDLKKARHFLDKLIEVSS